MDTPSPIASNHTNKRSKRPSKMTRHLLPVLVIALVTGLGWFAYAFITQPKPCLTINDYPQLTGKDLVGDLSAKDNFHTYTVNFKPGSTNYDDSIDQTGDQIIDQISNFYQTHSDKSIILTLESSYLKDDEFALTKDRLVKIRDQLVAAGLPADAVVTDSSHTELEAEDQENQMAAITTATISIRSASQCR